MRISRLLLAVLLATAFYPAFARAQGSATTTVTGTVMDQKGAVVPGADVELQNVATNDSRTQTTNDTGVYIFSSVAPGDYKVVIKKAGFRTTSIGPVAAQVGKPLTVDTTLEIGTVSEVVEVQAGAQVELQTNDASIGNVINRKMMENIPSLGRDATALLLLQPLASPGFNAPGSPNASGEGDNTGGQVAGARSDQNTFLLDGGDATDSTAGSGQYAGTNFTATPRAVVPTPVESLEEFRVVSNNPDAGFGRSAGGEVQMVTRSGTNIFHGALYEYLQNNALNANSWTRNSHGQKDPALRDNRFGGRIGGPIWKDKTFFFAHYEGRRFVSSTDIARPVPSAAMKAGILHFVDSSGATVAYNLNPVPTVDPLTGATVAPSGFDPRGLGLNPTIAAVWAFEPGGNDPNGSGADGLNNLGFSAAAKTPLTEDFGVIKIDHNFNSKWQLMSSYRYGKTVFQSPVQVDIGGLISGDTKGVPRSTAVRPLAPRYLVIGLTGQITPHLTSDFHFDYLRHWWQWGTSAPFPQVATTNSALSIGGEGIFVGMQPINVDTQNARSRVWNGKDFNFFENLSWIHGNHNVQFGGRAETQRFFHRRDDKVIGGLTSIVYTVGRLASGSGISIPAGNAPPTCNPPAIQTNCLLASDVQNWNNFYSSVLGLVDRGQQLLTRAPNLSPNKAGDPLLQHTVVNSYQLYFTDSWRIRPSLTINLGLTWGVQMPPYEQSGNATMMVDHATGALITGDAYIAKRKAAALAGMIYNPQLDFVPIKSTGRKYPYDPDYKNFAPRISVAWNPSYTDGFLSSILGNRKSVIRGGYARVYDRINGVGIVMIPALGIGFGNNVRCKGPRMPVAGVVNCTPGATPANSFRIGTDGAGIPLPGLAAITSPLIPGTNSPFETLDFRIDPKRKVGYADTFNITLQRELPGKMVMEVGYVGNFSRRLYQGYGLSQVPYMMTAGGQSFAQAFSAIANALRGGAAPGAIPNQAWFETMLGGSAYCTGFASCTQASIAQEGTSAFRFANLYDVWDDQNGFYPASLATPGSIQGGGADTNQVYDSYFIGSNGRSNYNAGFFSLRKQTSNGLTLNFNYTFSHAFDQIGQNQESLNETSDAFNLNRDYGSASFDRRHAITALVTYDLPFGRGSRFSSGNWFDRVIGGWNMAGVWNYGSGLPLDVYYGNSCEEYGQGGVFGNCSAYIPITKTSYSLSPHQLGAGVVNGFADPTAARLNFRTPDVLLDGRTGRGAVRSLGRWGVDFGLSKTTKITERVSTRFDMQITNVFNHPLLQNSDATDAHLNVASRSGFGVLNTQYNQPRFIQFGLRLDF
ncbi:MAG: carboxypeptidase regulatory-like domain-containing protein [Acidipila sp.]|nr:carboxypeptidase regulatory-like domain-containing protein [Acidipila sp.]